MLRLDVLNNTPIFTIETPQLTEWDRVFGATRQETRWVFPAYYPFGFWVIQDLQRIKPNLLLSGESQQQVSKLEKLHILAEKVEKFREQKAFKKIEALIEYPSSFNYFLAPLQHQPYGIFRLVNRWRELLFWDMGTGKTKTVVETLRILKCNKEFKRALVIAPPVVIPTWEREPYKHGKGEIKVLSWIPTNKLSRSELFSQAEYVDIVVMSYARARMEIMDYGVKKWTLNNLEKVARERSLRKEKAITEKEIKEYETYVKTNILDLQYDVIIADEAHNLGNASSDQTKALLKLSTKASRRYELTGTSGDRPDKFYAQLQFLSPALLSMSYEKFCEKFLIAHPQKKYLIMGYRNLQILNGIVDSVASRMKKSECLDLPPITIQDIVIEPGYKQIARYNEIAKEMRASEEIDIRYLLNPSEVNELQTKTILNIAHGAARVTKLLQVASGFLILGADTSICDTCPYQEKCVRENIQPYTKNCVVIQIKPKTEVIRDFENPKLETLKYYLEQILADDPTNKILIWGIYLQELDDIENLVKQLNVEYVRVDGSNTSHIQKFEDQFQLNHKCRVYIGQVQSGVGITLTAANYAIYYSLPWHRTDYRQSLDRNNRYGQTRPMHVYRLMLRGTLNEFMGILLDHKDYVAYTLTEKITCASCEKQLTCASQASNSLYTILHHLL
jgi:SNF2 family DNA or RNA helicase